MLKLRLSLTLLLLFFFFNDFAAPQSLVKTLPGYSGTLPFKLETGYVSVGEIDDVQLFYYFIESEGDPSRDPLMLWLTGGPGCSAFSGLVYEIGPLGFDFEAFDGSLPSFLLNPYSWTKMAKVYCHEQYVNPGPDNAWCLYALQFYQECIRDIYQLNVLEPKCKPRSSKPEDLESGTTYSIIRILPRSNGEESWCREDNYLLSYVWANDLAVQEALHVRKGTIKEWERCNKSLSYDYNVQSVVEYHQLLSKKGYAVLVYSGDHDMRIPYIGTLKWIRLLNMTIGDDWRPWIVDGQVAGYTERYIHKKTQSYLTFATVKGAGHTAPEYKPKQCFLVLDRFFENYPL